MNVKESVKKYAIKFLKDIDTLHNSDSKIAFKFITIYFESVLVI